MAKPAAGSRGEMGDVPFRIFVRDRERETEHIARLFLGHFFEYFKIEKNSES